jgi:hypothetical protein
VAKLQRNAVFAEKFVTLCHTFLGLPCIADEIIRREISMKEQKEAHEVAIGNQLLKALELDGKFIRHGKDDGEPDLIYSLGGRTVGIEVATAYYHEGQATVEWKLVRGEIKPDPPRWVKLGVPNDPNKVIRSVVQKELDDKCAKRYSGVDAVWLCIEQHAPLATVAETEELIAAITVPSNQYERIYLGFHASLNDGGGFRVFTLFGGPTS